jgi:hypothetical protein
MENFAMQLIENWHLYSVLRDQAMRHAKMLSVPFRKYWKRSGRAFVLIDQRQGSREQLETRSRRLDLRAC